MKKVFYLIMICLIGLNLVGCDNKLNTEVNNQNENNLGSPKTLEELQDRIIDAVQSKEEYKNFSGCYINYNIDKVVIKLVDNSEEEQNKFLENVYNSNDIVFEQGGPYSTSNYNVVLNENNSKEYNKYLEKDNRIIYMVGNIKEIYIRQNETLKFYLTNTYQTLDDGIKSITSSLNKVAVIRDGGSSIYKSKNNNLTIVVCNNLNGNKDIYIGDYSSNFEEFMCK